MTNEFLSLLSIMREKFFRPGEKITRPQLSHAQFHAISMLHQRGPLHISELANEMKISKQQTTPLICKLIQSGLVVRKTDEHDRRIVRLEITETGRSTFEELRLEIKQAFAAKLEVLPDMELDELDQMIRRIREILQGVE